jgi:hypothetical protein
MTYLSNLPAVQNLLQGADHFDAKVIEGNVTLCEFIAGTLSYYPWWIKGLYGIRARFVRLLGMQQEYMAMHASHHKLYRFK